MAVYIYICVPRRRRLELDVMPTLESMIDLDTIRRYQTRLERNSRRIIDGRGEIDLDRTLS